MLKRDGWEVNAKRIYRLYKEEGVIKRTKRRNERALRERVAQGPAVRRKDKWNTDFLAQRISDGRWIRGMQTVIDQHTRECLTLPYGHGSGTGLRIQVVRPRRPG